MRLPVVALLSLYSALLIVGGVVGYFKACSRASLITGVISGILVGGCVALEVTGQELGRTLGMTLALLLGIIFGYRYALKPKLMPSGLLTVVSIAVLVILFFITPMPPG